MQYQRFSIAFDDGYSVDVQTKSRDLLRMESDGLILSEMKPIQGTYTLAWYALARLHRAGDLAGRDLPTLEEFLDSADIEAPEDDDPEGNA